MNIIGLVTSQSNEDSWIKAIKKQNTLLCLRLSENGKAFCIGTYHMPCSYNNNSIMLLHTATCVQLMNKFANNSRYILAGDFNFTPSSLMYKMITKGGNYNQYMDVSLNLDTSQCSVKLSTPLISVYCLSGIEPSFTNYSHVKNKSVFKDCIDYIFVSRGLKVNSIQTLQEKPIETENGYPFANEPSDHLLLAADLELVERSSKPI
jgi:mRNA deadenylase 3'-5' endonuclease subunit Ccr4